MHSRIVPLLLGLFIFGLGCDDPPCRPGEIKLADTCYKRAAATDSGFSSASEEEDDDPNPGRLAPRAGVDASVFTLVDGGRVNGDSSSIPTPIDELSTQVAACASNPCQHGGKCTDAGSSAICDCASTGYSGAHCEAEVDECVTDPCMNGGKCTDAVDGYTCDCQGTGFSGARCQSTVDDCLSNPCLHDGKCSDGLDATTCDCTGTGYSGLRCETNVDDCAEKPCRNGGTCNGLHR
jgi:hypothetical protein